MVKEISMDFKSYKIPASRFEMLDKETNIGSYSFGADTGSDVLNTAKETVTDITSGAEELYASAKESVLDTVASAKDALSEYTREPLSQLNSIIDYAKTPIDTLKKFLGGATGGKADVTKSTTDLLSKCRAGGSGVGYGGKPYDVNMSCKGNTASIGSPGSSSSCTATGFNDIINKISNGGYNASIKDVQSALNALMSLSGYGAGLGVCGVFGALKDSSGFSSILGKNEFTKASAGMLSSMSQTKNVKGWMDTASSSAGLDSLLCYPDAVDDFFSNFEIPDGIKDIDLDNLCDRAMGAAELVEPDWLTDAYAELNAAKLGLLSEGASDMFESSLLSNAFDEDNLDYIPGMDSDFMKAAAAPASSNLATNGTNKGKPSLFTSFSSVKLAENGTNEGKPSLFTSFSSVKLSD